MNGPAAFQQLINETLGMDYLENFITAFINNLIIYLKNTVKYEQHMKIVLKWLWDAELQASIKKYEFHITWTKYLGFILITDGIEVDLEKIQIIYNWKVPNTIQGI